MSPSLSRWSSVVLGVAATAALAFSTQVAWWSYAEVDVLLTRAWRCFDGTCQRAPLHFLGASEMWHRVATATFGLALLAAFLSVFVAGARAAGRIPRTAAGSLLVAVVTGTACGAYTLFTFPLTNMGTGPGSLLYVAGLLLAATSAGLVRKAKPIAKDDGQDSSSAERKATGDSDAKSDVPAAAP